MEHIIEYNRKAFIDILRSFLLFSVLSATNSKNQIKSYQLMCKASIAAQLVKLKSYIPKFRSERVSSNARINTSFAFNFISFWFFFFFVHYSIFKIIFSFFSFFLFAQHVRVCVYVWVVSHLFLICVCVVLAKLLLRLIYQNILKGWNINTFSSSGKGKMAQTVIVVVVV